VNHNPTRVLNALLALSDNPDDIDLYETDGHTELLLGNGLSLALGLSSQAALDKLATVTAQAAADNRARTLRTVA
jgi:hypothetical protein